MKVDFPQPESAATPIITGVTPDSSAMSRAEVDWTLAPNLGMKAEEEKAAAVVKRVEAATMNFILMD